MENKKIKSDEEYLKKGDEYYKKYELMLLDLVESLHLCSIFFMEMSEHISEQMLCGKVPIKDLYCELCDVNKKTMDIIVPFVEKYDKNMEH